MLSARNPLRALISNFCGWGMLSRRLAAPGTRLRILVSLFVMLLPTGCTRSDVALGLTIAPPTSEIKRTAAPFVKHVDSPTYPEPVGSAAVWVPATENLVLRQPAGLSGAVVRELPYNARNLETTGQHTWLGSSEWSEIRLEQGVLGWAPAWNLTEDVPPSAFCEDARIDTIRRQLITALSTQDGDAFSALINPERGLVIRYQWYMDELVLPADQMTTEFDNGQQRVWGALADSGIELQGAFSEIVLPKLLDVLQNPHQVACNQLLLGESPKDLSWPSEFENINYLALHRSAPEGGNVFDWRTWILGIEYVDGEPTIGLLLQFSTEF